MNRITLITGASSGIGKAITHLLSQNGHKIFAISRFPEKIIQNKNIIPFKADLTNEKDIDEICNNIGINYKVKYVVHSAGIVGSLKQLYKQNYQEIEYITKLNLIAPIYLNNILIKNNKFLDRSRILNISSEAAHYPILQLPSYSVTKAGLYQSFRIMKQELLEKSIYFGCLKPGIVDTPMLRQIFPRLPSQMDKDLIQPETVAEMVQFLLDQIDDKEFYSYDWDIYQRSVQKRWLKGDKQIPLMAPDLYNNLK